MRSKWIILNKLWQYTRGCTIREKSYITRERELTMFPLSDFSDSAPWLHPFCCRNYPSSLLLFQVPDVKKSSFWSHLQQQKCLFLLSPTTQLIVTTILYTIQQKASQLPHINGLYVCQLSVTLLVIPSSWGDHAESDPSLPFRAFLCKFG